MRRRRPRRAGPVHWGGEGRGGPPTGPLAQVAEAKAKAEMADDRFRGGSTDLVTLPPMAREVVNVLSDLAGDAGWTTIADELREAAQEDCDHHWIDIRNKAVESGEMCERCLRIRPGNEGP